MADTKKDVQPVSSAGELDVLLDSSTGKDVLPDSSTGEGAESTEPSTPSSEGDTDVEGAAGAEPSDRLENLRMESERKQKEIEELRAEKQWLLESFGRQGAPATPQRAADAGLSAEGVYEEADRVGISREQLDFLGRLQMGQQRAAEQREFAERVNLHNQQVESEVGRLLTEQEDLAPFQREIYSLLNQTDAGIRVKKSPALLAKRAAETVRGAHFDELVTAREANARKDAGKRRRITGESASMSSIKVGSDTHQVDAGLSRAMDMIIAERNASLDSNDPDYDKNKLTREKILANAARRKREGEHIPPGLGGE